MNAVPALPTFDTFRDAAFERGFGEVVSRTWEPGAVVPDHGHPFDVEALVIAGDLWLTVEGRTRHLRSGDRFTLARDEVHAERYGEDGATYWVARR